jgi:Putative transposase/Transposase zinc-binding domain
VLYHSCRHRACPRCGHDTPDRWLAKQRELLLPVRYFHLVFTLPAEIAVVVRSHQKALLPVLFRAAFEALARLYKDKRYLGTRRIGGLAVLHTWTRTLGWHPHIHLLVPGGGLTPDGGAWVRPKARRTPYLVPVKALSNAFRGRFLHLARRALPGVALPEVPRSKRWVVFAKPAVQGADKVLDYLGRYVHRTALSDKAIVACDEQSVTFTYRKSGESARRTMKLPAAEFLRRFLQHVPPKGMHRVRTFGLLHRAQRTTLRRLQLRLAKPVAAEAPDKPPAPPRKGTDRRCPHCGQSALRPVRRLSPAECAEREQRAEREAGPRARAPP